MPTIADQLNELVKQKETLVDNLNTMGVTADKKEKLNTLVPKVLDIQTGIDTSDATANINKILEGETAYVNGEKITGVIPSVTKNEYTPSGDAQTIKSGQYIEDDITINGDTNLSPDNIKNGVTIFGVEGTFTSDATALASDIKSGVIAYTNSERIVGTAYVAGTVTATVDGKEQHLKEGFYDGISIPAEPNLTPGNIKKDITVYGVTGTLEDSGIDTSDADAEPNNILDGKTAYVNGKKITGNIPSVGPLTYIPNTEDQAIPSGKYISENLTVKGDSNLIPENIKYNSSIFGVNGTFTYVDPKSGIDTASGASVLKDKVFFINGIQGKGTMDSYNGNNGSFEFTPTTQNIVVPTNRKYVKNNITIKGDDNLIPTNIKKGMSIFGVEGTYEGDVQPSRPVEVFNALFAESAETILNRYKGLVKGKSTSEENFHDLTIPEAINQFGFYYDTNSKMGGISFVPTDDQIVYLTEQFTITNQKSLVKMVYYMSNLADAVIDVVFVNANDIESAEEKFKTQNFDVKCSLRVYPAYMRTPVFKEIDNLKPGTYYIGIAYSKATINEFILDYVAIVENNS